MGGCDLIFAINVFATLACVFAAPPGLSEGGWPNAFDLSLIIVYLFDSQFNRLAHGLETK